MQVQDCYWYHKAKRTKLSTTIALPIEPAVKDDQLVNRIYLYLDFV